ncbi:MAG: PAS domain S-box protein [SAR324 cluster bacterium]|nr:PAS domain S-box protein [SAR324 cluster bacterium]
MESLEHLREQAKNQIKPHDEELENLSKMDLQELVHDLRVHQIELQMQNEEMLRTQEELIKTRNRFRELYNSAPVGYFTIEQNGLVLDANITGLDLLKIEKDQLLGRPLSQFFTEEHVAVFYHHHKQIVTGSKTRIFELGMIRQDGSRFYAHLHGAKGAESTKIPQYRLVISDITEKREAEVMSERLNSIIESTSDMIGMADQQGNILYLNQAGKKMMEFEDDVDVTQTQIMDYHPGQIADFILNQGIPKSIEHGVWHAETKVRTSNLNEIPVSQVFICHKDAAGKIDQFSTIIRDISEQKNLENQLRQSQKMEAIGTMAGGIAHEFNNILAIMLGYVDLMLEDEGNFDSVSLRQVKKAGGRAKQLVKQILAFSRPDLMHTHSMPIALSPLIKEALQMLRATFPSTIQIKRCLDKNCRPVQADITQIHQILVNLCNNARQSLENDTGDIDVILEEKQISITNVPHSQMKAGNYAVLTVKDTGHGMTPEVMARIFDPFFTTKEVGQGTGLGLSVVHGIMENHNGVITVDSKPGQGTSFSLFFPIVENAPAEKELDDTPVKRGSEHVMVVDDELVLINYYTSALKHHGYQVTACTNGKSALELFRSRPAQFDLVITDQTMPGLTGDTLCKELLLLRPDIPVILTTGYSDHISEKQAHAIGVKTYMLKPVELQDLLRALRDLLD